MGVGWLAIKWNPNRPRLDREALQELRGFVGRLAYQKGSSTWWNPWEIPKNRGVVGLEWEVIWFLLLFGFLGYSKLGYVSWAGW